VKSASLVAARAFTAIKEALRGRVPRAVAYSAYLKALFQNEVELRLLSLLCNRDEVTIDVGAYTGTYTIGLSIHSKSVIAVEPQSRQAAALRRAMPSNVTVLETALSNVAGRAVMKLSSPGGGSMSRLDGGLSSTEEWPELLVRLMRMDELRTARVGFVKIDAEGHELEVLRGAHNILQLDKPHIIVEAEERYDVGAVSRVDGFLHGFGYDGYFVRREQILSIGEFNVERDQNPKLLVSGQRRAYRDYINNFIFLHPARVTNMPKTLPSPWHAIYNTIRGFRPKQKTT
jgi:FkbM family methyltransferase